jgi:hypothetical protein
MSSTLGCAQRAVTGACVFFILAIGTAEAQTYPGDPKPDLNIVGPTRDPGDIRDEGLKQQNEPACAMRPGDGDCIVCFFNDYRTVDLLGHQDAWIGQAESCDSANTWTSRIVPGHPNHDAPIGTKFAADPRVIALPGMAIHGFIGGFRDQDSGIIAVQHWLENNKDDFDYYEPGLHTLIVDEGTEGRFIDKPDFLAVLDESVPQKTVTLTTEMENESLGSITRTYPAGTLYAAYAVFTGSQSVKLLVKTSDDWGVTWRNKTTKLTESQNLVTGITMTSLNGIVMAMWRQILDTNDVDAIYYATTDNGGQTWSKPELLTEICKFDQPSATFATQVTFRTNDFPWLANDGKNFYAFFTERLGGCSTGTPKVMMKYLTPGDADWSPPRQVADSPGAQVMPAAFGARGKVQVAWYDTSREGIPLTDSQPFIADFIPENGIRVNRKVDVFTARITSDANGDNVQVSEPIQVNRYRAVASASDPNGLLYEVEASFANAMMYKSGLLSFLGDYFAVTAPEFRQRPDGGWEQNHSAVPGSGNLVDFFIAYADHRDVRGDILFGDGGSTKPYTPPVNAPATGDAVGAAVPEQPAEPQELMAAAESKPRRQSAAGIEDDYTNPEMFVCTPGTDADRTRDANIYGALIRDRLRLSTPVESRPLSGILRAIPFGVSNVEDVKKPYRLFIANQPASDPVWHRASFRQTPDRPPFPLDEPPIIVEDVVVPPNSSVARTVFVQSTDLAATIDVQIFDGDCAAASDPPAPTEDPSAPTEGDPLAFTTVCPVLGSITIGGVSTAGDIQQPDYLSSVCEGITGCGDVLLTELHNPLIENPLIENPLIENPLIENPLIENPLIENPLIENPLIENYGFENPLIENPLIENPLIENPLIENPLIENPLIENPLIENTALADGVTYTDITVVVRNDGNVTTAYNVDGTVAGFTSTAGDDAVSQLILWKQYVYGTARDCKYVPEARDQVVATINQPDNNLATVSIDDPFNGEGSIILAPGEQGFATFRLWGTPGELEFARLGSFAVWSQAANCSEFDNTVGPPAGQEDNFYSCENTIASERELALLELDTTAPTFTGLTDGQIIPVPFIEANTRGGACIDPVASGMVAATDDSAEPVDINCFNAEGDEICSFAGDVGLSVPVGNLVADPGLSSMTCVASDSVGNFSTVNVLVDVLDTTAPIFTKWPVSPTVVQAGEVTGTAQVTLETGFAAEDVDGVDPSPVISCITSTGLTSGDELPAGDNHVTCTATDASGNSSERSHVVRVDDVTHPKVTLVGATPQIVEVGSSYVELGATSSDNVGVVGGVAIDALAVDTTKTGDYLVSYTAVDAAGNETLALRTVRVVDTVPPIFSGPLVDIVRDAMPDGTVSVSFVITATDASGEVPTVTCVPASGSIFPVGTTSVTCTATDAAGNSVSETFDVIVTDSTAPTLVVPTVAVVESAADANGAIVDYLATDAVDPAPALSCTPPSGSTFPVGTTSVTCTATDAAGNQATASFDVTVVDTAAPTLVVPTSAVVESAADANGATVNYATLVTATDLVDATPALSCAPPSGSTFPLGTTSVVCTATDAAGNSVSRSFEVAVVATDAVDPAPALSCTPPSGSTFPVGTTSVTCTATDAAGNSATASFDVTVIDTTPPTLVVPASTVFELIQGPDGSVVDYASLVEATDLVDPAPVLTCNPASGTTFAPGETTVNCTATDSSSNTATGSFTVQVGYVGYGIIPTKLTIKSGSSNPLMWGWGDEEGNNFDSSGDTQWVRIVDCDDPDVIVLDEAGDPGASGFRFKVDLSWEFNWQATYADGSPLPNGRSYCASVMNMRTMQSLESPPIEVR